MWFGVGFKDSFKVESNLNEQTILKMSKILLGTEEFHPNKNCKNSLIKISLKIV